MQIPEIHVHRGDLPRTIKFKESVAVDTETMGLVPNRDRLCVVQLSDGSGVCHLVQILRGTDPVYLKEILQDKSILKIFHFARFDVATIFQSLGILTTPIYCTKIASRLTRNFSPRHGLKNLISDLLGVEISKQQRSSDWGADTLTKEQQAYAATDVLYLHRLKIILDELLEREGRGHLAQACFDFLPTVAQLDLLGYQDLELLRHD